MLTVKRIIGITCAENSKNMFAFVRVIHGRLRLFSGHAVVYGSNTLVDVTPAGPCNTATSGHNSVLSTIRSKKHPLALTSDC